MHVFLNSEHQLRSGWKFAAFIVMLVPLWIAAGILLVTLVATIQPELLQSRNDIGLLGLNAVGLFPSAMLATWIMARFVDHAPLAVFGIVFHERWLRDLLYGIAVAVGMCALLLLGTLAFGGMNIDWNGIPPGVGTSLLFTFAVLVLAAANEELMFRGYPLQVLLKGMGPWPAVIFISVLFGALHAWNPGATFTGVLNTVLAGIMLSVAYLKTRSLWLPLGVHLGWNAGIGVVLGYPVSGLHLPSLLTTQPLGTAAIVGGAYGPEEGLLGTFIFIATSAAIRMGRTRVSPRLREAMSANAEKIYVSD